jgi:hypothetical protein
MRHACGHMQRTTTSCNATCMQHAACNGQRGIKKRPLTTGNKPTRQQCHMRHAADTAQKTAKLCSACNRQRATDSRRHARGREHMRAATRKHTAPLTFVRDEKRAADKQQHARSIVLDNQCAARHRRHTHDVTHDRCRSMQQTHAEPTPRSRRFNVRDYVTRRTESGLAPRGCAGLSAVGVLEIPWRYLRCRSPTLTLSLACVHRWPTDVGRPRCGIRTRLGAREAHAVGSCCTPRPRLPASRGPMKPPALPTMSLYSALAFRVLRRCFHCAATRGASCPCQSCRRRATSRQARSACENGGFVASQS